MRTKTTISWIAIAALGSLIGTTMLLAGCEEDPHRYDKSQSTAGARTELTLISTVLGCSIYHVRFEGPTQSMYMTVCDGTNKADLSYMDGKVTRTVLSGTTADIPAAVVPATTALPVVDPSLNFSTDERKILEQAEQIHRKFEILDRLSTEDKAVLGFTVKK